MDSQCAVCHKKNDQLLMLSCSHDPCIDCAATHYFAGAEFRREFQLMKEANYWCEVCFEPTAIDKTSISQLNQYLGRKYKQRHYQAMGRSRSKSKSPTTLRSSPEDAFHRFNKAKKKIKQSNVEIEKLISLASSQEILKSNYNLTHSQYGNQMKNSIKEAKNANQPLIKKNNCIYHDDQIKNYYCFTCLQSICVQCALHGSHVGHQVEAVKKASTKLKVVYDNLINESEKCRAVLEGNIKDIDKIIDFFRMWNEQQIKLIKQKFKQLLDILISKQQQILNQIQSNQKSEILKLNQVKKKQEEQISELKLQKKNLKKSVSVQSLNWNIEQIESSKNQLKKFLANTETQSFNLKKMETDIQYVQTQIILEALQTIQQLVHSFKITLKNKTPSKKCDEIYFYKTT